MTYSLENEKNQDINNARVAKYNEIKDFLRKNATKILNEYAVMFNDKKDNEVAKFLKTKSSSISTRSLSSTAICTYALVQCGKYCEENSCFEKMGIASTDKYWNTIMDILKIGCKETDIQAPDEFTVLNVMSLLGEIKDPDKINREDRDLIEKIILSLCTQFIDNQFIFREKGIHPFLYYRFYRLLTYWESHIRKEYRELLEERIESKYGKDISSKFSKKDGWYFKWFYSRIYENGKYEMYRQIALRSADDMTLFDVKRLVYSLLIVSKQEEYSNNMIAKKALEIIFNEQLPTGLLPICHVVDNDFILINIYKIHQREVSAVPLLLSFECLADMLSEDALREDLENYEINFRLAFEWVKRRLRKEDGTPIGWFPEYESTHVTESWVAGHVLIFLKSYCDFLIRLIRQE